MEEAVREGEVYQENFFCFFPGFCCTGHLKVARHKSKLVERFDDFTRGLWSKLLGASVKCDEDAATA